MKRIDLNDLQVFITIVRRSSFKLAAIELGLTPSAISHSIRRLEERLEVRLLNRTTRSVSATSIGEALALKLNNGFDMISSAIEFAESPGSEKFGQLKINVFSDAAHNLISPALPEFIKQCPNVRLFIVSEERPIDIISEGYDAGIRYGYLVPEDMVAVPLTDKQQWVAVASPDYIKFFGEPKTPNDLHNHKCIQLVIGDKTTFKWEFQSTDSLLRINVPGTVAINDTSTTISAAISGVGIAYVLRSRVEKHLLSGELVILLQEYTLVSEPFSMYYSTRRFTHPALKNLINIIRTNNGLDRLIDSFNIHY